MLDPEELRKSSNIVEIFFIFFLYFLEKCPQISSGEQVGTVTSPSIDEASGLVASQTHSDVFWTMNDSDGPHCIYALNKYGQRILTLCLTHASNYDWEAISTAPCYER